MKRKILIDYPEYLALSLKMSDSEFAKEMKTISLVKLYELGKISSGIAAKVLNISRIEFLEILKDYNVSYFHDSIEDDLLKDFQNT